MPGNPVGAAVDLSKAKGSEINDLISLETLVHTDTDAIFLCRLQKGTCNCPQRAKRYFEGLFHSGLAV